MANFLKFIYPPMDRQIKKKLKIRTNRQTNSLKEGWTVGQSFY